MTSGGVPVRLMTVLLAGSLLVACAEAEFLFRTVKRMRTAAEPEPVPTYKVGKPYQIEGIWFYPREDDHYDETGIASWYGQDFHGKSTANGEIFDMNALTAAHRTLPVPSFVRVTNLENGRSLVLRLNDRGPFAKGRIIDVSRRASQLLGFYDRGTARVRVVILANESRAVAARLKAKAQLADAGTPITVNKMPKPRVHAQAMPPPPGGQGQSGPLPARLNDPSASQVASADRRRSTAPAPNDGEVSQTPVRRTSIFVQAGAYAKVENAQKVRARLSDIGPVVMIPVMVNAKSLYRVRVGPLATVPEADRMLDVVAEAGFPEARIVVD